MHFIVSKHELRAAERLHHDTSELERRILDLDTFISHIYFISNKSSGASN